MFRVIALGLAVCLALDVLFLVGWARLKRHEPPGDETNHLWGGSD